MNRVEWRASISLAGLSGLRLLGLFIILPVFGPYAEQLPGGSNHALIGLALGAYGLTQAILQMPFGWLSDRFDRKRVIYAGLLLFAIGSFVAAMATSIWIVVLGRILQGAGAISAAAMALAADLTRDEHRTKAMAIIGMTIGFMFAASMVLGPVLDRWIGVPGIFAMTGVLALAGLAVTRWIVPDPGPDQHSHDRDIEPAKFRTVLFDPDLARLNFGIFALHAALMALWIVIPFALVRAGLSASQSWEIYLPVVVLGFVLMLPAILYGERRGRMKQTFIGGVAVLLIAQVLLALGIESLTGTTIALLVFFTGFNLLEAMLPSLISKAAPPSAKGTALGAFSSIQFFGAFLGATVGGFLSQYYGTTAVFTFCGLLTLSWLIVAGGMKHPVQVRTRTFPVPRMDGSKADGLAQQLAGLPGVREALVKAGEGVAYLKVDARSFDEARVIRLLAAQN
ncbi:MAG: MFS transporter [Burkholderiales bacterium]